MPVTKSQKIHRWKEQGLIGDYEKIYERYVNTTHCDLCSIELTKGNHRYGKCMDHCHKTGEFRNVICRSCNSRLPRQEKKLRKTNSSGHKGITYIKNKKLWCYRDRRNGKTFQKQSKSKITLLTYKFCHLLLSKSF